VLAVLAAASALTPAIPPEPGATLTISVTKPGMAGMTKTLPADRHQDAVVTLGEQSR
jgi:hypothetical protein